MEVATFSLIQNQAQDIKTVTPKLRGTAPRSLRWLVWGAYITVSLTILGNTFGFLLYQQDKSRLAAVKQREVATARQLATAKQELTRAQGAKQFFLQRQTWLSRNYAVTAIYRTLFAAVPQKLRIVGLEIRDNQAIDMKAEFKARLIVQVEFQAAGEEQASLSRFSAAILDKGMQMENIRQEMTPAGRILYSFELPVR